MNRKNSTTKIDSHVYLQSLHNVSFDFQKRNTGSLQSIRRAAMLLNRPLMFGRAGGACIPAPPLAVPTSASEGGLGGGGGGSWPFFSEEFDAVTSSSVGTDEDIFSFSTSALRLSSVMTASLVVLVVVVGDCAEIPDIPLPSLLGRTSEPDLEAVTLRRFIDTCRPDFGRDALVLGRSALAEPFAPSLLAASSPFPAC